VKRDLVQVVRFVSVSVETIQVALEELVGCFGAVGAVGSNGAKKPLNVFNKAGLAIHEIDLVAIGL
jgi:hypothetical protein